jgi:hypothetical protein
MTFASPIPLRHRAFGALLTSAAIMAPQGAEAQQQAAQTGGGAPAQVSSGDGDDIVVTGQALPGAVIGDIPPENKLGQAEIASYGVDSIAELLDELADQTTSIAGRDASSGPVVLVNGKRVSGVNEVGDLPVESVLRVDILPEEVAIKYGYDAQSKVVNIILKRRFQSKVVNLGGGMSGEGGGGQGTGAFTYTKIRDNDRLNITGKATSQAAIRESDRDITADPDSTVTPVDSIPGESDYRTVQASTRSYALGASLAHQLSSNATASFNVKGTYQTSRSLDGLATGELTVPADSPYADGTENTFTRYLSQDPLRKAVNSGGVSAGGTVNVDLSTRWKLSVIGSYAHSESETRADNGYDVTSLQDALDAGSAGVDPYGTLSPALLGNMIVNRAKSNSDTGSASMLVSGKVLPLPAGDLGVSLKLGGDFTAQSSTSVRDGMASSGDADRTNGSARLSVDIPLTSRSRGVLGAIGTLSVNLNAGVTQVSDYGSLATFGYGLNWRPRDGITVIAAMNQDRSAPTVANLGDPTVTTSNQRIYDYVTGQTVLVTAITGGNPNLKADDRRSFKLGLNAQVMSTPKLNFSATYVNSRNRNAVLSLGGVTQAVEDAYPDRFIRDEDGNLLSVDARPVNVYRQRSEQVRWGFNLSAQLRKPTRPPRPPAGTWGRRGPGGRAETGGETPPAPPAGEERPADGHSPEDGTGNEITVNGDRERGAEIPGFGRPPGDRGFDEGRGPPDGMGPPPDGMGPPPGEGPGGGPGGFGGGPRGPGGRGFGGGGDNGVRLLASLYHTWVLRQDVQLAEGGPTIDLLDGGTITGSSTPRHKVQGSLGLIDNGLGLRLEGNWQSSADVTGSTSASGNLHFASLATVDLRVFANLQNRFRGKDWARGTRVSLSVENLFNQRQKVTDDTGATPYAYQRDYLDPMGRTVLLSLRRIF